MNTGPRPVLVRGESSTGAAPAIAPRGAVADLGRIFYVEDVLAIYAGRGGGDSRRSREWVLAHFAPAARHREGRLIYWFERDVVAWFRATLEAPESRP